MCQAAAPGRSGQPPAAPAVQRPAAARGTRCGPAAARSGPGHGAGPAAVPLPAAGRAPGSCAAPSAGSGEGWRAGEGRGAGEERGGRRAEGRGAAVLTARAGAEPACTSCVLGNERAGPSARRLKGTGRPPPTAPGAGPGPPRNPVGEAGPPPLGSREGPRDLPPFPHPALRRLRSPLPCGGGAPRSDAPRERREALV